MLAIRLTRTGKINAPHYRIVVQEKRSKLNGKSVDVIGHYHPAQADKLLVINKEKAAEWIKKGAQPSDTVTNLFVKEGILDKSHTVHHFFTPGKVEEKKEEKVEETADEAVEAAETTESTDSEAPAEEATPEVAAEEEALAPETPAQEVATDETETTPEA